MAEVTEKALEQVSSEDLFKSAMTPEAEPPVEATPPEPVVAPVEPPPPAPPVPEAEPTIPPWRLREEAEARRVAEDRARALEQRLNEVALHMRQNQKQPDFFENPSQATQELILQTLRPFVEQQQQVAEEQRRERMFLGKQLAETRHGEDKVAQAEKAFLEARDKQVLDPADYERVVQSPNRYDAVVHWHRRQATLSAVGDDPNAWFEKQLEAKMADPVFQAKLLEKVRGDAAGKPSMTKLPPSLSRTTASASNREDPLGDMSDKSLFSYAMKR